MQQAQTCEVLGVSLNVSKIKLNNEYPENIWLGSRINVPVSRQLTNFFDFGDFFLTIKMKMII